MDATISAAPKLERVGSRFSVPLRQQVPIALVSAFVAAILVAAAVYQPWVNTPFDIIDFSEFLPFLRQSDTFAQRFGDFLNYYAGQGRLNLLSYSFLIWKWSLFGWSEAGWQIARFIQMLCIVVGVYLLLRRFGATRSGSAAGAALLIVAHTASPAWIRLTMGEPLGLLPIVCASLIATRYQGASRWRAYGIAIAALLMASLLAKEMLVAFVPFVLLLACSQNSHGRFEMPRLTKRNLWLVLLVACGVTVVLVPVAIVALRTGPGAYSSGYAVGSMSLAKFIYVLSVFVLPAPVGQVSRAPLASFSANVTFFVVVTVGFGLAQSNQTSRRHFQPLAMGALALALLGALIYLPWPYFQAYYGLPFLLSPAILLAIAVTSIENSRLSGRWLAFAGCIAIFAQGSLYAAHDARRAIAARMVNGALIEDLAQHPSADSMVVVMRDRPPSAQAWQGRGPTLARYAKAVLPGRHLPTIHEASCSVVPPILSEGAGNAVLISYSSSCGTLPTYSRTIRYDYTFLHWPTFAPRRDSLVISILGPEPSSDNLAPVASAHTPIGLEVPSR